MVTPTSRKEVDKRLSLAMKAASRGIATIISSASRNYVMQCFCSHVLFTKLAAIATNQGIPTVAWLPSYSAQYRGKHWRVETLADLVNCHKFAKVSSTKTPCLISLHYKCSHSPNFNVTKVFLYMVFVVSFKTFGGAMSKHLRHGLGVNDQFLLVLMKRKLAVSNQDLA